MSKPSKIVKMTDEQSANYRRLRDEAKTAEKVFTAFLSAFKMNHDPSTRHYAPSEMEIVDQPAERPGAADGGTYAYFETPLK